jgi:nitric oxide synthase oxygenase domain/subunit
MTTDDFCFYLQNRLIQTGQTGSQWYSDTSPFSFPLNVPLTCTVYQGLTQLMVCWYAVLHADAFHAKEI